MVASQGICVMSPRKLYLAIPLYGIIAVSLNSVVVSPLTAL